MTAISKHKRNAELDALDKELQDVPVKKQRLLSSSSSSSSSSSIFSSNSRSNELAQLSDEALVTVPVKDRSTLERLMRLQRKTASLQYSAFPDPALCLNHVDHIYRDLYEKEQAYRPQPYMLRQRDISSAFRGILINWLCSIHDRESLLPRVFWLTVNLLDRYLEAESVERKILQLVGMTALFIACKFEDSTIIEVHDCVFLMQNQYTDQEVLDMELKMLQKLDFVVHVPTGYHFLQRYLSAIKASETLQHVASYYAERNLQEYDMLKVASHQFAAAAVYAALVQKAQHGEAAHNIIVWPHILQEESGLREADIIGTARTLVVHLREEAEQTPLPTKLDNVVLKYSDEKYGNVASLPLPSI